MNTHSIELDGYYARCRGSSTVYLGTAGSHGNEQLQVTLGKGWEGLTIQVVFHPSQVAVQLPANGLLDVPWEATENPLTAMQGRIVFQGFDQDRLVNSTDLAYTVASHSAAVGRNEEPYTPGIVEGVLNQMAADKDAILQAAQQTGQAKEAAAASASQAAGSATAAGETLIQVQTAGQKAQQKVKDAETDALDKIAAAAPALPAVFTDAAWQSATVKPDGSGYNLAALAPIEATIRPTVTGNPAVCENSAAWGLQGLKIYGKSVQNGMPSPENPVPIVSSGEGGILKMNISGLNLFNSSEHYDGIMSGGNIGQTVAPTTNSAYPNAVYFPRIAVDSSKKYSWDFSALENGSIRFYSNDNISTMNSIALSGKQLGFSLAEGTNFISINSFNGMIAPCMFCEGEDLLPYESFKTPQSITLSTPGGLPGIPVELGGNYTDSAGQQWICNDRDYAAGLDTIATAEIVSYNGEPITTPYISSTGALTTGAQVIYALPEPYTQPIPAEDMAVYYALTTYAGTTVVSTAEPVAGLEVQYVADGTKYAQKVQSMESRLAALEAAQTGI